MTRFGWKTQGEVTRFPHIGGVAAVTSWNSPSVSSPTPFHRYLPHWLTPYQKCGTCWSATYKGKTVYILAVDHAAEGVNMALSAMNELTNNQAVALGRIDAVVSQVAVSFCGL